MIAKRRHADNILCDVFLLFVYDLLVLADPKRTPPPTPALRTRHSPGPCSLRPAWWGIFSAKSAKNAYYFSMKSFLPLVPNRLVQTIRSTGGFALYFDVKK